ncbi:MAG: YjiH family protein [Lachnospiraceae bacterium]|nr:YjiH family protein [Lachnospiraceae bacterium]
MSKTEAKSGSNIAKFIICNALGIFMFFVSVPFAVKIGSFAYNKTSLPVDHIVSLVRAIPFFDTIYGPAMIVIGALLPFIRGTWKKDTVTKVFSFLKLLAIPVLAVWLFKPKFIPELWFTPDMLPFIYNKVVLPVSTLVPIGAVFLAFLIGYGLMEFIGIFLKPVMRPIWKTPGRSAIDAVASFVGSYSVGLLITNRVYKEGKYTNKEACIIATGFSTVSATFMVVVAKTLGVSGETQYLMQNWNLYFWSTLIITFLVTAITTRIFPLGTKKDEGYKGQVVPGDPEIPKGKLFATALDEGLEACSKADNILVGLKKNFIDGINMALAIAPSLMSVGFIGLLLAAYTPIFTWIGYIFVPFAMLLGFGKEAVTMGTSCSITLAEMFLPAGIVGGASLYAQMTTAIVCVSEILFFSASIPCVLGTDIDISLGDILIIWVERVILSLILAGLCVRFIYPMFGIPVFG